MNQAPNLSAETTQIPSTPEVPPAAAPPELPSNLTPQQCKAIHSLAAGRSTREAARVAGVDRSTLYRWRKSDPSFMAALNAWRKDVQQTTRDRLLSLSEMATLTVCRAMRKGNAQIAMQLLKTLECLKAPPGGSDDVEELRTQLYSELAKDALRRVDLRKSARDSLRSATFRRMGVVDDLHRDVKLTEEIGYRSAPDDRQMAERRKLDEMCVEAEGLTVEQLLAAEVVEDVEAPHPRSAAAADAAAKSAAKAAAAKAAQQTGEAKK